MKILKTISTHYQIQKVIYALFRREIMRWKFGNIWKMEKNDYWFIVNGLSEKDGFYIHKICKCYSTRVNLRSVRIYSYVQKD